MLARGEPGDGRAIVGDGLCKEDNLIVRQSLKPLTQLPLQANPALRAPALEGIRGKKAVSRGLPVPVGEVMLSDDPRQLRAQRRGGETQVVAGWFVDRPHGGGRIVRSLRNPTSRVCNEADAQSQFLGEVTGSPNSSSETDEGQGDVGWGRGLAGNGDNHRPLTNSTRDRGPLDQEDSEAVLRE